MTAYSEREARRQAWQEAHPTSTPTPKKRQTLDVPEGIVTPAENNETWTGKDDSLLLVGLVALAPLWLPAWGVYLIWDWWDLRRRPSGTCLTFHPALKDFRPED